MIGAWTMNIAGRVYGPYTADRMRSFIAEGRLAPHSLITREGASDWHEARHEPEFYDLFPHSPMAGTNGAPAAGNISFGEVTDHGRAQFAIIVDLKSRSTGNLEKAIMALGPAYKLMPTVWILSTDQSVSAVRNRLVQELGKLDTLFVVDATRGKAAWFNFGPEADVRIRRVWHKPM
jgi:hypothetical protein